MPNVNVVTCGTSLLRNGIPRENAVLGKVFLETSNKREKDYSPEERRQIDSLISAQRKKLLTANEAGARSLSAELNGLIGYYREHGGFGGSERDMTYLICTDTYQGEQVAQILAEWGEKHKMLLLPQKQEYLNTAGIAEFQLGMNSLVEWCEKVLPESRKRGYHIVFNLVGGFKSLQGYMQTLGMFYADEIVYIFETGGVLLSIPPLPVNLTESARLTVYDNLRLVRSLARIKMKQAECFALPAAMLKIIDDMCWLSPWGMLMFQRFKKELYQEKLLEPWEDSVIFTEKAKNAARGFDAQKLFQFNSQVDDLCVYQITGDNPRSLRVHGLVGGKQPKYPNSTHEFYVSDVDAWRGYIHFEGKKMIVDDLGPHL